MGDPLAVRVRVSQGGENASSRVYHPPAPTQVALGDLRSILASPSLVLLAETDRHTELMGAVLQASGARDGQPRPRRAYRGAVPRGTASPTPHRGSRLLAFPWTADRAPLLSALLAACTGRPAGAHGRAELAHLEAAARVDPELGGEGGDRAERGPQLPAQREPWPGGTAPPERLHEGPRDSRGGGPCAAACRSAAQSTQGRR